MSWLLCVSSSPYDSLNHGVFPGDHPSKYLRSTALDCRDLMGTGVSSPIGRRVEIVETQSTSKAGERKLLLAHWKRDVCRFIKAKRPHALIKLLWLLPCVKYTWVRLAFQLHRVCDWRRETGFRKSRRDTGKEKGAHLLFWRKAYSRYFLWFFFLTWMLLCCFSLFHFCSRN